MRGGRGGDNITDSQGGDSLQGGGGDDVILDYDGSDLVRGGTGPDHVEVDDQPAARSKRHRGFTDDAVKCGQNTDSLDADAVDVYSGCEQVTIVP
jgi:hypothetical protein